MTFLAILRKLCVLAVFGFLAIALAGPILALFSVVLCFALLGFLLWLPFHLLVHGRASNWTPGLEKVRCCARWGGEAAWAACHGVMRVGGQMQSTIRGTASVVGAFLLEMISGALVGVMLAVTCAAPQGVTPHAVALAAAVGGVVGVLVVVSRMRPGHHRVVEQS
jgi:hypothetical protein